MKMKLVGLVSVALIAGVTLANAEEVSFDYTNGTLNAVGVLNVDVMSGQATSGSGTISGGGLTGTESLTLVTLATPAVHDLGSGNLSYRFGGGTDLIGDTTFNSSAPYVDSGGLVFLVGGLTIRASTFGTRRQRAIPDFWRAPRSIANLITAR